MTALRRFANKVRRELDSKQLLVGISLAFGGIAFLISELMHYLLVPGLGRHGERMIAEGVSALIVGFLAAQLFTRTIERRRLVASRLQVIEAMNHHIRNALDVISLSTYTSHDKHSVALISEAIDRIDWALREILPHNVPWSEGERERLFFLDSQNARDNKIQT